MMKFNVSDMTCGHCASMVTKAILMLQDDASVEVDLVKKIVTVSSELTAEEISSAIKEAGYMVSEVHTGCCTPSQSCKV